MSVITGSTPASALSLSNYVGLRRAKTSLLILTYPGPPQQLGEPLGKGASAQVFSVFHAGPCLGRG